MEIQKKTVAHEFPSTSGECKYTAAHERRCINPGN